MSHDYQLCSTLSTSTESHNIASHTAIHELTSQQTKQQISKHHWHDNNLYILKFNDTNDSSTSHWSQGLNHLSITHRHSTDWTPEVKIPPIEQFADLSICSEAISLHFQDYPKFQDEWCWGDVICFVKLKILTFLLQFMVFTSKNEILEHGVHNNLNES